MCRTFLLFTQKISFVLQKMKLVAYVYSNAYNEGVRIM